MRKISVLVLVFGLVFTGCASRKAIQKVTQPETQQQKVASEKIEEKIMVSPEKTEERITEQRIAKIDTKEIETPEYREGSIIFENIYFDFDKYDIRSDAKPTLDTIASRLLENTGVEILIEGHCDKRGTYEYNLALGDRRAKVTRDYLVASGIASGRFETISYGEEKPLSLEKTEEGWQKNRRAQFVILEKERK